MVDNIKQKFKTTIGALETLLEKASDVEAKEVWLKQREDSLAVKRDKVAKQQFSVKSTLDKAESRKAEIVNMLSTLAGEKKVFKVLKEKQEVFQEQIDRVTKQLKTREDNVRNLEDRNQDNIDKEKTLNEREEGIIDREANIQKEKAIARERKIILDRREGKVELREAKVQRYLEI